MVFKRLYNVLRANINSGEKTGRTYDNNVGGEEDSRSYNSPLDPVKEKELKYLSNLELQEGAGFEDIKKAYKTLIKRYHPDKFYDDEEKRKYAEKVTRQLNEAYDYFERKYGR